ncbi:hypothetical protein ACIPSA_36825 [Streptomyces sp. NPDC086549]|uniref:hypothetical protein n=1 Tax=Streptomyces sp. NPDC086549 TaxID=3365752 RepID=UPI0037FB03EA
MGAQGRRRRWLIAAIAVLPALGMLWLVVTVWRLMTWDPDQGEKVPCAEALAFGGAELPDGAYDTDCSVRAWMDTDYWARFRMPRDGVHDWLKKTYPDAADDPDRLGESCDDTADLCLELGLTPGDDDYGGHVPGSTATGFGADGVSVSVTYEGPDRALVRFSAFTE